MSADQEHRSRLRAGRGHHRSVLAQGLLVVAAIIVWHAFSVLNVHAFYNANDPHYDSVGTLTYGFRIIESYGRGGYSGAASFVSENGALSALSLTQAWFAWLFAPILERTPESLQLYNTLATACALIAIYIWAAGAGVNRLLRLPLAFIYFLPDGLWWWDFGLLDYRRDAGMLGFLTGAFFLLLTLYSGGWTPRGRRRVSLLLGVFAGLTLVSRDSAPAYLFGLVLAPCLVLVAMDAVRNRWSHAAGRILPAALGFAPFVALFASQWDTMSERFDPLIGYARGAAGALTSLVDNGTVVGEMMWGTGRDIGFTKAPWLTIAGVAVVAGAMGWLWAAGRLRPTRTPAPPGALVGPAGLAAVTGIWAIVWVHGFLSLVVKWPPSLPFFELVPPFLPAVIGWVALLAAACVSFRFRSSDAGRAAVAAVVCVGVLGLSQLRILERTYSTPQEVKAAHRAVSKLTSTGGSPPVFGEAWFDGLKIPVLAYRAAQAGVPPPQRITFEFENGVYDTAIGTPDTPARRDAMFAAMDRALRCKADFVIATTHLESYEQPGAGPAILHFGRPMVQRLLRDLPRAAGPFKLEGLEVVVLDNRARRTCKR